MLNLNIFFCITTSVKYILGVKEQKFNMLSLNIIKQIVK